MLVRFHWRYHGVVLLPYWLVVSEKICGFEKQAGEKVIRRLYFCRLENSVIVGIGVDADMLRMLADFYNGCIRERLFTTTTIFFLWFTKSYRITHRLSPRIEKINKSGSDDYY